VFAHIAGKVPRFCPLPGPGVGYKTGPQLLSAAGGHTLPSRRTFLNGGMMLGLGESRTEPTKVMVDLRAAGCELLSIGQYRCPSPEYAPVARFVCPEEFQSIRTEASGMGFSAVEAGPLVRSSCRLPQMREAARVVPRPGNWSGVVGSGA